MYHHAAPFPVPCVERNDVMVMDHGSWVMWIMGQVCDGSLGSWITKDDPLPSLLYVGPEYNKFIR